jgi:hypothetical protein
MHEVKCYIEQGLFCLASVLRPAANQSLLLNFSVFSVFSAAGLRTTSRILAGNLLTLVRTFLPGYNYKVTILNSLHICSSTTSLKRKQTAFVA